MYTLYTYSVHAHQMLHCTHLKGVSDVLTDFLGLLLDAVEYSASLSSSAVIPRPFHRGDDLAVLKAAVEVRSRPFFSGLRLEDCELQTDTPLNSQTRPPTHSHTPVRLESQRQMHTASALYSVYTGTHTYVCLRFASQRSIANITMQYRLSTGLSHSTYKNLSPCSTYIHTYICTYIHTSPVSSPLMTDRLVPAFPLGTPP